KEEIKQWVERDPIERYKKILISQKILTEKEDRDLEKEAISQIEEAAKFARESPFPEPSEVEDDVYA
ncbi:MAG: thiamine pyrophosphate-dependent enzyme, partial [Candidatus Hydromicrobium sp.]|nr:thiamine pyrophosphate-dependent enzyme [Candidatus Hydromicrobium sp.]